MNVKTVKKDKGILLLELDGESIGFANLIREELWNDKNVSEAASIKEHPYMSQPRIYAKMKGKYSPTSALKSAAKRVGVKVTELKKDFQRNIKD